MFSAEARRSDDGMDHEWACGGSPLAKGFLSSWVCCGDWKAVCELGRGCDRDSRGISRPIVVTAFVNTAPSALARSPPTPGDRSMNSSSFPKIHGPLHPQEGALLEAHCDRTVLGRGHHLAALGVAFLCGGG